MTSRNADLKRLAKLSQEIISGTRRVEKLYAERKEIFARRIEAKDVTHADLARAAHVQRSEVSRVALSLRREKTK